MQKFLHLFTIQEFLCLILTSGNFPSVKKDKIPDKVREENCSWSATAYLTFAHKPLRAIALSTFRGCVRFELSSNVGNRSTSSLKLSSYCWVLSRPMMLRLMTKSITACQFGCLSIHWFYPYGDYYKEFASKGLTQWCLI